MKIYFNLGLNFYNMSVSLKLLTKQEIQFLTNSTRKPYKKIGWGMKLKLKSINIKYKYLRNTNYVLIQFPGFTLNADYYSTLIRKIG